jgi:hypothetical protein
MVMAASIMHHPYKDKSALNGNQEIHFLSKTHWRVPERQAGRRTALGAVEPTARLFKSESQGQRR